MTDPNRAAVEIWKALAEAQGEKLLLLMRLTEQFANAVESGNSELLEDLAAVGRRALAAIHADHAQQLADAELRIKPDWIDEIDAYLKKRGED